MPFVVCTFGSRKQGMTPEEFKDYYENKHMALIKKLAGDDFPTSHKRFYMGRKPASEPGAVGEPNVVLGQSSHFDWDAMAVISFDDEEKAKRYMGILEHPEKSKILAEDEEKFADRPTFRAVTLGDVFESKA